MRRKGQPNGSKAEKQAERIRSELEAEWGRYFPAQDRDIDRFPEPVCRKAVLIAADLAEEKHCSTVQGRRLPDGRIRFDLPQHYRLVGSERTGRVGELKVLSHETYNHLFPSGPR